MQWFYAQRSLLIKVEATTASRVALHIALRKPRIKKSTSCAEKNRTRLLEVLLHKQETNDCYTRAASGCETKVRSMARADRHTKLVSDVAAQAIGGVEFRACLEPINETTNMADVRRTSASRVAILAVESGRSSSSNLVCAIDRLTQLSRRTIP